MAYGINNNLREFTLKRTSFIAVPSLCLCAVCLVFTLSMLGIHLSHKQQRILCIVLVEARSCHFLALYSMISTTLFTQSNERAGNGCSSQSAYTSIAVRCALKTHSVMMCVFFSCFGGVLLLYCWLFRRHLVLAFNFSLSQLPSIAFRGLRASGIVGCVRFKSRIFDGRQHK